MDSEDFFYTISAPVRAPELKVRGSRFIADILPVHSKEEVAHALETVRKEFHDASHHCFAYRLGPDGALLRAADDGEPSGTAGKPILLVLSSQKLTNALIIVTRFFGGTKLGTGGLARAYAEAAQQAVSMSHVVKVYLTVPVNIRVLYEDLPAMERLIKAYDSHVTQSTYLASVELTVNIRASKVEEFVHTVTDTFHGRAEARAEK